MTDMPLGTVTFLFTDIEGSTRLWEEHPEAMRSALARHDALMRAAFEQHDGHVFKTVGDAFCAAFHTAPEALQAALTAQQTLLAEPWPDGVTIKVRMALHTGAPEVRDHDYFGQPLNRIARLLSIGYGGQVLLSDVTYDLCRDTLSPPCSLRNLGEHRLRDLTRPETIFQLLHPALPSKFPPLKSLDHLPNNLPLQLTSFIGREMEATEITALLTKTRLLTLTGAGGCGKTRLALQVAAEMLEQYPDGVWLVELASLADPDLAPQAVAQALGVKEQAGQILQQTLLDTLRNKRLLLIVDNCEHLLAACAQLTSALLRACPQVKILSTSREALAIRGEQVYYVPSLSIPDPKRILSWEMLFQYEAVRLFIERAQKVKPDFAVTKTNAPALAQVCHHLDGIPLAIELAAARVRALSVEGINSRLGNDFRLLIGGDRTALPRHQTLHATIDWSCELLSEQERLLLARLSVFAGGWSLVAAEQVGAGESAAGGGIEEWEVLDLLTSLVDKSLVVYEEQGEPERYRMLETIRQYNREKLNQLGEENAVRQRQYDFFLPIAKQASAHYNTSEANEWNHQLAVEYDNLIAVLDWCLEARKAEAGLEFGINLCLFWAWHGYVAEGRSRLEQLLKNGDIPVPLKDQTINTMVISGLYRGADEGVTEILERMLQRQRAEEDVSAMAQTLNSLGYCMHLRERNEIARRFLEESLIYKQELGDETIVWTRSVLARVASAQQDDLLAYTLHQQNLDVFKERTDRQGIGWSALSLAEIAERRQDYPSAVEMIVQSAVAFEEIGDRSSLAWAHLIWGRILKKQAEYVQAREHLISSLSLWEPNNIECKTWSLVELSDVARLEDEFILARARLQESLMMWLSAEPRNVRQVLHSLQRLAQLAAIEGQAEWASRLLGATEALGEKGHLALIDIDRDVEILRTALGEERFADVWYEGRKMSLEQAIQYARKQEIG